MAMNRPGTRPQAAHALVLALFCGTLFLSAALLFSVQLMVARMILPLLGGTPAVWNTCLVFFQVVLLAGYAYAHLLPARFGVRGQLLVHAALLLVPLLILPVSVVGWVPPSEAAPAAWLLLLLSATTGLPFFVVSTSAPLLQQWFARTGHPASGDPYFLYAASNLGSLGALLSYPVLVEPHLGLAAQSRVWSAGYVLLALLVLACAARVWRSPVAKTAAADPEKSAAGPGPDPRGLRGLARRLRWVALAFVPSSLLLGVTNYLSTDVASAPLLWVLPLALYLLSFILAFARLRLLHPVFVLLLPLGIWLLLEVSALPPNRLKMTEVAGLHLALVFVAMTVCHGELARTRPPAGRLTEFYLLLALGGALGGTFNSLVAPRLFDRVVEYPLLLAAACLLLPRMGLPEGRRRLDLGVTAAVGLLGAAFVVPLLGVTGRHAFAPVVHRERNFFGVLRVEATPANDLRFLFHGTTLHGMQSLLPAARREPLGYFHRAGPVGRVFDALGGSRKDVAVVGLGAGTLAAYAQPGQRWTFYEIDPAVERLASDPRYFTYLADARERGADAGVVLGDARLRLRDSDRTYDLIILDAFSSDTVPVHLLTREALRVYLARLADDGLLAFHISCLHVRLHPVVGNLAKDAGLACRIRQDLKISQADMRAGKLTSEWVVLARRPEALGPLANDPHWPPLPGDPASPVWTDDYSNLFRAINWEEKPYVFK
jgi:hypothetical protein